MSHFVEQLLLFDLIVSTSTYDDIFLQFNDKPTIVVINLLTNNEIIGFMFYFLDIIL